MPLPTFYHDPNGDFKINDRKIKSASSSARSSSSHPVQVIRVEPTLPSFSSRSNLVPVVEVAPPSHARLAEVRTEIRTPRSGSGTSQHLVIRPPLPSSRNSPRPDRTFIAVPPSRRPPPLSPSSARVNFESRLAVPPHAPDPPPAAPQTSLRTPASPYVPIDLRSDPGSQRSSSSHSQSRKAQSDRGHARQHSTSTVSTAGSSSSRRSDAQTAPTTVSGTSGTSGSKKETRLLEEPPRTLPRVRIAEEHIEIADAQGKKRISRYRFP